jgi:two-component system sensor histidine kinase VanS
MLIERFLTVAQIQTSHDFDEVDLADITADVTARLVEFATARNVELRLRLDDAVVCGDAVLMTALVDNLVRNAIVHNVPQGYVDVSVNSDGTAGRVTIVNTGHQVTVDNLCRRGTTRSDGDGSGVGLSIAQSIVAIHDGILTLTPLETGGLRAVVELPAPAALPLRSAISTKRDAVHTERTASSGP